MATEPSMDLLISKLIPPYLASRSSNKAVSLLLKHHCPGNIADVFQVCCDDGVCFASHLGNLYFHNNGWLHVSICGTSFSLFFSKLLQLLVWGLGLGVSISLAQGSRTYGLRARCGYHDDNICLAWHFLNTIVTNQTFSVIFLQSHQQHHAAPEENCWFCLKMHMLVNKLVALTVE